MVGYEVNGNAWNKSEKMVSDGTYRHVDGTTKTLRSAVRCATPPLSYGDCVMEAHLHYVCHDEP